MCTLLGVRYLMFAVSAVSGSHWLWYDPWVVYKSDHYFAGILYKFSKGSP